MGAGSGVARTLAGREWQPNEIQSGQVFSRDNEMSKRIATQLGLILTSAGIIILITSSAQPQAGAPKSAVNLQSSTPGTSQSGHANISGTMRAGQFVGGGAGLTSISWSSLTGVPSTLLTLPYSGSASQGASLQAVFDVGNSYTGANAVYTGKFTTAAPSGMALYGGATNTTANAFGGYFETFAPSGTGVFGRSAHASGIVNGVWGQTQSSNGRAIYGQAQHPSGYGAYIEGRGYFSGNLGLGVLSPSTALDVNGTITTTGFRMSTGAAAGRVLTSDATGNASWQVAGTGGPPSGPATGDLGGTYPAPTVVGLQGRGLLSTAPTSGQVIAYNGASWAPANDGVALPFTGSFNQGTANQSVFSVTNSYTGSNVVYTGYFSTAGFNSAAVFGIATATTSSLSLGGSFQTNGTLGAGVMGYASSSTGATYGVIGRTASNSGRGVWGQATAASGTTYGVYGEATSTSGYAGYFSGRGYFSGNVGIGNLSPASPLDVTGNIRASSITLTTGAGAGLVLTSDASGNATWAAPGGGGPTGPAGGDLGGTYPNPLVDGLQGRGVSSAVPVTAQVLAWSGTTWAPTDDGLLLPFTKSLSTVSGYLINLTNSNATGNGLYAAGQLIGVRGDANGASGTGIYGAGAGKGVFGTSSAGYGVHGSAVSGTGLYGDSSSNNGVEGSSGSSSSSGVWGHNQGGGWGVAGVTTSTAVNGSAGVWGLNNGNGVGVRGTAPALGFAGYFEGRGYFSDKVGIGQSNPAEMLHVVGNLRIDNGDIRSWGAIDLRPDVDNTGDAIVRILDGNGNEKSRFHSNGYLGIGTNNPDTPLRVNGTAKVTILEITGGGDVAERFEVRGTVKPGMLVEIDPDQPGHLRLTTGSYSPLVAGVVSGARKLNPGVLLDPSTSKNSKPIAMTGRVWVYCDATRGAISPGSMLTSSPTPGYAMAVKDYDRAHGTVIGKAMSRLPKGQKGLVLALVSLQ